MPSYSIMAGRNLMMDDFLFILENITEICCGLYLKFLEID